MEVLIRMKVFLTSLFWNYGVVRCLLFLILLPGLGVARLHWQTGAPGYRQSLIYPVLLRSPYKVSPYEKFMSSKPNAQEYEKQ